MKHLRLVLFSIPLVVLAFAVISYAGTGPGSGFTDSPHDFSANGANTQAVGACTFCHTPHKAQQTRLLWNHTLSSTNYTWTDATTTMGGTTLPTITAGAAGWKGPTKFCLSCHDGTVAIGDIAWFKEQSRTGGDALNPTRHSSGEFNIANVGDMKGNHPVAFPYPWYNGAISTYNGVTTGAQLASDLAKEALGGAPGAEFNTDPTTLGIRLFNDSGADVAAGPVASKTGIECTSCHGVHNEPGFVVEDLLLRGKLIGNSGTPAATGYICMKCHTR